MTERLQQTSAHDPSLTVGSSGINPGFEMLEPYAVEQLPEGLEALQKLMYVISLPTEKPKADSFADALAEQQMAGVSLIGFEGDKDFVDLDGVLKVTFGKELLDSCLVEKVVYHGESVLIKTDGKHYVVPNAEYPAAAATNPDISAARVRAYSTSIFNTGPAMKRYQRLPIGVYSFEGESLDDKSYLPEGLNDIAKMRLYKLGTIIHEVAHSIFNYRLNPDDNKAWEDANSQGASLTAYAAKYEGKPAWLAEQFSEAIRLYVTNSSYLRKINPAVYGLVERRFPSLQADALLQAQS